MPSVSSFIPRPAPKRPSFKEFQDLPVLVRRGLVWGEVCKEPVMSHQIAQWIIDRYDVNQIVGIGQMLILLESFVRSSVRRRMITCYVDHKCNMLAAKLAWHEDY